MKDTNTRQDFEDKVNNKRYKTAQIVHSGEFIEITDSYMQDPISGTGKKAVFWGKLRGQMGVWLEVQLHNYCL